jgi:hypothetical protein
MGFIYAAVQHGQGTGRREDPAIQIRSCERQRVESQGVHSLALSQPHPFLRIVFTV